MLKFIFDGMKFLKSFIVNIPNGITSLNMLCGCMSIVCAFNNRLVLAAVLIFLAGIFDFFDGFAARLLNAYSEMGKSLDSLADVVSFGVAPSVIMMQLLIMSLLAEHPQFNLREATFPMLVIVFSSFIIAIFSALRLAKFNTDSRQSESFIGVPTPANAFFVASLVFVIQNSSNAASIILNFRILIPVLLILSYLLVAELPMISLKFKNLKLKDNQGQYLLILISLLFFAIFRFSAYPLIFVAYLIISLIFNPQKKQKVIN